jgi:hypothetical protein
MAVKSDSTRRRELKVRGKHFPAPRYDESLLSIKFESNPHLTRIESEAFSSSSLQSILILRNVEIVGPKYFSLCESPSLIPFESNSHFAQITSAAFSFSSLQSILIPSSILFIASDAMDIASQIRFIDRDSCTEFGRWPEVRGSRISRGFQRIQRMGFGLRWLRDHVVNLSTLEERSIYAESDEIFCYG